MLTVDHDRPSFVSPYLPRVADILNVWPQTQLETRYELRLETGEVLGHVPGQFVQVSIWGVGECPISICSSPTRSENFELTVRRVGEVTTAIHRLGVGDAVGIRGPLGHGFDVNRLHGSDLLIISGGCALAPARSLIQYVHDRRALFGDFHLLYGAKTPSEILFRDEVAEWQRRSDVNCLVTVDRSEPGWTGHVGLVTALFDRLPRLDPRRTRVVVIGPPAMFKFVMLEVLARGIEKDHIDCSLERRMKCGIGKCGHCQVNHLYACVDGPVFNFAQLTGVREAIE